jgi:ketosteroid isomerase-like protein
MKKLLALTLLVAFIAPAFSQKASEQTALEQMVATERAFAKLSLDQGTREAFMAYIADDGILFRPAAVKGKQWMKDHSVPPSDKRPLLSWYPAVAGMARAGDLGYTTGPWDFKSDINEAKPVGWGHFLTVWKKQADGSWKFAIDLGISHPQPAQAAAQWELPKNYKAPGRMKGVWSFSTEALLARDREFAKDSATRGARAAFASFAAADVRVYREEKFPLVGQELAAAVLPASPTVWSWEPAFADVSSSDDLGYTYGTYKIETDAKTAETGNYLRIWKKGGGGWKVIFDLTNPIPPEKKE